MDGQSTVWFSAFCTGIGPAMLAMAKTDDSATGAAKQHAFVTTYTTTADAFATAAKALGALPPPTFPNGDKLASTTVQTLSAAAPVMKKAAADIAAVDPSDETALDAAIEKADQQTNTVMSGMDRIDLDTATQQALRKMPACAMFTGGGDGAGSGSGGSPSQPTG